MSDDCIDVIAKFIAIVLIQLEYLYTENQAPQLILNSYNVIMHLGY